MRRSVARAGLAIILVALILGGTVLAGRWMRIQLRDHERFRFAFADIECPAPPGVDRSEFLSEIQYTGNFADHLSTLDRDLPERLTSALRKHGWVEAVEACEIHSGNRVSVRLRFRTPVLVVQCTDVSKKPATRVVDGNGIVLPRTVSADGLPRLAGQWKPPQATGIAWGEPAVESAARVAAVIHPHQQSLRLMWLRIAGGDIRLFRGETDPGPTVIWGHAPNEETDDEATADQKVKQLLEYHSRHGDLAWPSPKVIHDVRRVVHPPKDTAKSTRS
jgi:hypothetical protein